MTQTQKVKRYIDSFGSITPVQAMKDLGIMRLAARINDLEKQGMKLERKMIYDRNRWGDPVHYMKYSKVMQG